MLEHGGEEGWRYGYGQGTNEKGEYGIRQVRAVPDQPDLGFGARYG